MSNMSYCRFQNTLSDLRECESVLDEAYNFSDIDLSTEESHALKRLITVCQSIVDHAERLENAEHFEEEEDEEDA